MSRAVGLANGSTTEQIISRGTLLGYSLTETKAVAAVATVQIRNGNMILKATEGGAGLTSFTLGVTVPPGSVQTTAGIAANATAADVKAALELLSNIEDDDITCAGAAAGPYTIEFGGTLAGHLVTMVATPTGGSGTVTITTVQDPMVAYVELAANASTNAQLPAIDCPNGVYINRIAGETTAVVYMM